jgi:hypothetical protein
VPTTKRPGSITGHHASRSSDAIANAVLAAGRPA